MCDIFGSRSKTAPRPSPNGHLDAAEAPMCPVKSLQPMLGKCHGNVPQNPHQGWFFLIHSGSMWLWLEMTCHRVCFESWANQWVSQHVVMVSGPVSCRTGISRLKSSLSFKDLFSAVRPPKTTIMPAAGPSRQTSVVKETGKWRELNWRIRLFVFRF